MKKNSNLSDGKLIDLIFKDKELFALIIDRYEKKLKRYVFYLTGDKEKVDDIVQNVFIKAYINLFSFNKKFKFSNWIYRIAHNEAVNFVKKESFFKKINLDFLNIAKEEDLEEEISKKEIKEKLKTCLDKLDGSYKEVLILHFFEEKSYKEISDILRISVSLVGVKINRGKRMLKKICQSI